MGLGCVDGGEQKGEKNVTRRNEKKCAVLHRSGQPNRLIIIITLSGRPPLRSLVRAEKKGESLSPRPSLSCLL